MSHFGCAQKYMDSSQTPMAKVGGKEMSEHGDVAFNGFLVVVAHDNE